MLDASGRTFRLDACLGTGGFGVVYRAHEVTSGLERTVAVKLLHTEAEEDSQQVMRLRDEARVLGLLNHPVIVRVYSLSRLDGRLALVMEYVDGEDLAGCLEADPPLTLRAGLEVVAQVADALDAALAAEGEDDEPLMLVHRDIKPSNIRVARTGHVRLLDFGLAHTESARRAAKTGNQTIPGTWQYMAPERMVAAPASSGDVFALGAILHEQVSGRRLFAGVDPMRLAGFAHTPDRFQAFVDERVQALHGPDEVVELIAHCLAADPRRRPSVASLAGRCQDLADQVGGQSLMQWARRRTWPPQRLVPDDNLGRILADATLAKVSSLPPPAPTERRSAPPQRSRWPRILAGITVFGLIGVGVACGMGGLASLGGVAAWLGFSEPSGVQPVPRGVPPSTDDGGRTFLDGLGLEGLDILHAQGDQISFAIHTSDVDEALEPFTAAGFEEVVRIPSEDAVVVDYVRGNTTLRVSISFTNQLGTVQPLTDGQGLLEELGVRGLSVLSADGRSAAFRLTSDDVDVILEPFLAAGFEERRRTESGVHVAVVLVRDDITLDVGIARSEGGGVGRVDRR